MRGQVFVAAAALLSAVTFAQPAAAEQYRSYHDEHVYRQDECRDSRQNRTVGGAVIGGVIGALLGREVADRGVRGEGAAVGAVVGAMAGGSIGRSTADCDRRVEGSYDPYYGERDDGYYRDDDRYGRDRRDGYSGGGYRESVYGGNDCRVDYITRYNRRGRAYTEEVTLCRDRYGDWRPVD